MTGETTPAPCAYDRRRALTGLHAVASRERPRCRWSWQAEGKWLYVPAEGLWRALVLATGTCFEWSFMTYPGRVRVSGGTSADIAVMYRAVKAGPSDKGELN